MTFSCLSPDEVRERYERSANKDTMIGVLADLTASTRGEVERFLGLTYGRVPEEDTVKRRKPPRIWDKKRARQLYDMGWTDKAIADEVGAVRGTIQQWRLREGLTCNREPVEDSHADKRRLYDMGLSDAEIAKALNFRPKTIANWRYQCGLPANRKSPDGGGA